MTIHLHANCVCVHMCAVALCDGQWYLYFETDSYAKEK